MTDLITVDEAKLHLGFHEDDEQDEALAAVVAEVSELIRGRTGRDFDQRTYTLTRNGRGRRAIQVPQTPILADPLPTATENGITLTVAVGYSTTADVVVDLEGGFFYRRLGLTAIPTSALGALVPGVWSKGLQNVTLGFTGGYIADDMPADIKRLARYMTAFLWKEEDRKEQGLSGRATGQGNINFLDDIPAIYKRILDRHTVPVQMEH